MLAVTFAILASSNMMLAKHISHKVYGDPPNTVYRMDTRGSLNPNQNDIFKKGFKSRGTNVNLIQHIVGNRRSAFIATTERLTLLTEEFAKNPYMFLSKHPSAVYIYTIRADSNFYGVERSVAGDFDFEGYFIPMVRKEREWVALRHIPTTLIRSVEEYNYDSGTDTYRRGDMVYNPYYVEATTIANSEPYTVVGIPSTRTANIVAGVGYNNSNVVGANFCPNPPSSSRDIDNYGIRGSCSNPLVLNIDHFDEELKAYKNYMLSNKLGYMKAWSHNEL